jgi:hypothetical protein
MQAKDIYQRLQSPASRIENFPKLDPFFDVSETDSHMQSILNLDSKFAEEEWLASPQHHEEEVFACLVEANNDEDDEERHSGYFGKTPKKELLSPTPLKQQLRDKNSENNTVFTRHEAGRENGPEYGYARDNYGCSNLFMHKENAVNYNGNRSTNATMNTSANRSMKMNTSTSPLSSTGIISPSTHHFESHDNNTASTTFRIPHSQDKRGEKLTLETLLETSRSIERKLKSVKGLSSPRMSDKDTFNKYKPTTTTTIEADMNLSSATKRIEMDTKLVTDVTDIDMRGMKTNDLYNNNNGNTIMTVMKTGSVPSSDINLNSKYYEEVKDCMSSPMLSRNTCTTNTTRNVRNMSTQTIITQPMYPLVDTTLEIQIKVDNNNIESDIIKPNPSSCNNGTDLSTVGNSINAISDSKVNDVTNMSISATSSKKDNVDHPATSQSNHDDNSEADEEDLWTSVATVDENDLSATPCKTNKKINNINEQSRPSPGPLFRHSPGLSPISNIHNKYQKNKYINNKSDNNNKNNQNETIYNSVNDDNNRFESNQYEIQGRLIKDNNYKNRQMPRTPMAMPIAPTIIHSVKSNDNQNNISILSMKDSDNDEIVGNLRYVTEAEGDCEHDNNFNNSLQSMSFIDHDLSLITTSRHHNTNNVSVNVNAQKASTTYISRYEVPHRGYVSNLNMKPDEQKTKTFKFSPPQAFITKNGVKTNDIDNNYMKAVASDTSSSPYRPPSVPVSNFIANKGIGYQGFSWTYPGSGRVAVTSDGGGTGTIGSSIFLNYSGGRGFMSNGLGTDTHTTHFWRRKLGV